MASAYTISVKGNIFGPVPLEQLSEDISRGWLLPDTYFWDPDRRQWYSVLQDPRLYEFFFQYQELELAAFKDPLNPNRRTFLTNRRLVVAPPSGRLDGALDSARRWLGTKLPAGLVQVPLDRITQITLELNSRPLMQTVEARVEYLDEKEHHEGLSLVLYPSDKGPFLKALDRTRHDLLIKDHTHDQDQLRRAGAAKVQISNVQGDLVQEKVGRKVVETHTNITDSVLNRSHIGPPPIPEEGSDEVPTKLKGRSWEAQPAGPTSASTCHSCGRPLQTDWKRCPYCLD